MPSAHKKITRKGLTPKQENFVTFIVTGCSKTEAYRRAFDKPKISNQAAAERAQGVMNRPGVKERLAEFRKKSDAVALLSVNDRLRILARDASVKGTTPAYIGARARVIKVYNELAGDRGPDRLEVSAPGGGPIQQEVVTRPETHRERWERMKAARDAARLAEQEAAAS